MIIYLQLTYLFTPPPLFVFLFLILFLRFPLFLALTDHISYISFFFFNYEGI